MSALAVERIMPQAGVRGGHIEVYGTGLTSEGLETCRLVFGSQATRPTLVTPTCLLGVIPKDATPNTVQIEQHGQRSNAVAFTIATQLAENLHPVANPAISSPTFSIKTIRPSERRVNPVARSSANSPRRSITLRN